MGIIWEVIISKVDAVKFIYTSIPSWFLNNYGENGRKLDLGESRVLIILHHLDKVGLGSSEISLVQGLYGWLDRVI